MDFPQLWVFTVICILKYVPGANQGLVHLLSIWLCCFSSITNHAVKPIISELPLGLILQARGKWVVNAESAACQNRKGTYHRGENLPCCNMWNDDGVVDL